MQELPVTALDPRIQKQIENAQVALQRGNSDYVVDVCSQILKAAPGCVQVRRLQMVALLKRFHAKNKFFSKAMGAVTQVGGLLGSKKDPLKGMENAEKILHADPTSVPALKMMVESATALEMFETAAFAWECIRDQQPTDHDTLVKLAEAYLLAKKPKEALKVADDLLRLKPQDGDALALMRRASVAQTMDKGNWETQGSFREKLRDEKLAVSLEQASKVVTSEEMTGRLVKEALERLEKQPDNIIHYRAVIDGYRKLGNVEEAIEWVRKARKLPSAASDVGFEKLEAELQVEVFEKAVSAAEVAGDAETMAKSKGDLLQFRLNEARSYVERYPNDYAARYTLAELCYESGDYQAAIANYQQAQKNPKVRIMALAGMGRSLKARKMYDLAVAQLQTAKSEIPVMDDLKKNVIYELAECYEQMGNAEAAIAEYKLIYADDIGFRDVADKINAFYSS